MARWLERLGSWGSERRIGLRESSDGAHFYLEGTMSNYSGPQNARVAGRWPFDPTVRDLGTFPEATWGGRFPPVVHSGRMMSPTSSSFGLSNTVMPPRRTSRAPSVTLLFAGLILGVLAGFVAILPTALAHHTAAVAFDQVAVGSPGPAAVAVPASVPVPAVDTPPLVTAAPPEAAPATIASDRTLVTFLAVGEGEHVVLDGHAVATADPTTMKCGKHTLRVAGGIKRKVTFPCGAALTLD